MSSSVDTDDELIDNENNNIIKTLQAHETSIHRDEAAIKEAKMRVGKLKNTISLETKATGVYLGLFSIKLFRSTTTQHLERM